jgi:hypothetical protein
LSSYFSYIIPSAGFDGSRSNNHQHDLKPIQALPVRHSNVNFKALDESLDNYVDCSPVCEKKVTPSNQEDDEQPTSGRSTSGSEMFEEATHSPQKPLPYLMDESVFISTYLYDFLLSSLPNIVKGCQWVLLYRLVFCFCFL